ncbi:ester cyclase [Arthrobacter sp. SO5]|uniref:ester cyclase n=1 Tax=Arthrobacter sp. SO5 TaxID=1897055 RepID=UPI001E4DD303|nr:ester cyclase [Arthrobacter sp. SO5]
MAGIPASGKSVEFDCTDIIRVEDGKVAERWGTAPGNNKGLSTFHLETRTALFAVRLRPLRPWDRVDRLQPPRRHASRRSLRRPWAASVRALP